MDQNNTQVQHPPMTPNQSAAALSFVTNLSNQFLPKAPPQAPQEPQQASEPQQQPDPMAEMQDMTTKIMDEIQTIKEDIKMVAQGNPKDEKTEIADLKKQIEEVLNSND